MHPCQSQVDLWKHKNTHFLMSGVLKECLLALRGLSKWASPAFLTTEQSRLPQPSEGPSAPAQALTPDTDSQCALVSSYKTKQNQTHQYAKMCFHSLPSLKEKIIFLKCCKSCCKNFLSLLTPKFHKYFVFVLTKKKTVLHLPNIIKLIGQIFKNI